MYNLLYVYQLYRITCLVCSEIVSETYVVVELHDLQPVYTVACRVSALSLTRKTREGRRTRRTLNPSRILQRKSLTELSGPVYKVLPHMDRHLCARV